MLYEYLIIEALVLIICCLINYYFKLGIFGSVKRLLFVALISFIVFTPWDTYALLNGHWGFNASKMIAFIWIFPIEELILILVLIPLVPVVFWELGKKVFHDV